MAKCKLQTSERLQKELSSQKGLYQSDYEHDACGVGMVVNIHGGKSHDLVDNALKVLENMEHRGAETRDKTGDGAGIMVQIPHEFILLQGIPVPEKGKYGTGLVFLPKDEKAQQDILSVMIEEIEREGLTLMHLRAVPTNPEVLGAAAREVEPDIKQIFVKRGLSPVPSSGREGGDYAQDEEAELNRKLYTIRKKIERRIDVHYSCQSAVVFFYSPLQFIADILSLEFISVCSRNNAYTLFISAESVFRYKAVFLYHQAFIYRQTDRCHYLNHYHHSFVCISSTLTSSFCVCIPFP